MKPMHLPCGGTAYFDYASGISYRCETCYAVVGSIGMPQACQASIDLYNKVLPTLGSKIKWNFETGKEEEVDYEDERC
jgi:hypothetical protein